MPHLYRFRNVWSVQAPADEVFKALADLHEYPSWWRDVRAVRQLDENSGQVNCRSLLPFALDLGLRRAEEEPDIGRLRVDITGDLVGFCGARVEDHGLWAIVQIVQEVELRKEPLRRYEPVLRPVLRANHAVMMWRGQRGLRKHLDGGSLS